MKKEFIAIICTIACCCICACKSVPIAINEQGPVAIISVIGNPALPWDIGDAEAESADDGNGVLTTLVNKLVDGSNPELQTGKDRLDYAVDSLRAALEENAGVEVISNETLLNSEAYRNINESLFNMIDSRIGATNFKMLTTLGSKRARLLMEEIGAKSLIFLDFDFRKTSSSGTKWTGNVIPVLTMKVHLLNAKGREVINRSFTLKGADSVRISNRKYDKDALVDLYPALIDNAINQFIVTYIQ